MQKAVLIFDGQTGKSRGYGFVRMMNCDATDRVVKGAKPIFDRRNVNVNLSYLCIKATANLHKEFTLSVRASYTTLEPGQYAGLPQ